VTSALPRADDLRLIPLDIDEDGTRSRYLLQPPLLRHDGAIYGGTAIAASMMAMEAASQRDVLWVTTQFVAPAPNGRVIEMHTDVLASGKRTAQLRVTATIDGAVMYASLGSTGIPREGGLSGQFESMPVVTPPEDSAPRTHGPPRAEAPTEPGWARVCEYLVPEVLSSERGGDGTMAMWTRFRSGRPDDRERAERGASGIGMSPAQIAFAADMVPVAIARGAGKMGAGTSLDNSMRFVGAADTEWALLELQGNMASGGYGHGIVRVWSQNGRLLAVGSQTASMVYMFDENEPPPFLSDATS
jgi:acyl-CoA thioesterase